MMIPKQAKYRALKMMGIDQFLWAPIFIPGFLAVTGAVHQQNLGEFINFQKLSFDVDSDFPLGHDQT